MPVDPATYSHQMDLANAMIPDECRDNLRSLRVWHWSRVLNHRRTAEDAQKAGLQALAAAHNAVADSHITGVQILNDFFPSGDTAERDLAMGYTVHPGLKRTIP